ncbi:hypothetical protein ACFFOM_13740 [Microlunatus capsulatus]|uniref:NfeD-like C-terminal domain-containing protein n=1 Tax=Microlunatus capsulatus TaxID=99117 RepID=A0ABS4Z814_9ACTN|nr:hypothetical protein [Microlunatus capsulatus]MBP2417191.1 hypothetical protein [Microlunatus capsulatus]
MLVALVIVAVCVLLPTVLQYLAVSVVILIVVAVITRKLRLGWGISGITSWQGRREKPRLLITKFRVDVPRPDDPTRAARSFSCSLITRQVDGAVQISKGDEVAVIGSGKGEISVRSVRVLSTGYVAKRAGHAFPAMTAGMTLGLLAVAGLALWWNRDQLTRAMLSQQLMAVEQSIVHLAGLAITIAVIWLVVKRLFRRF